MDGEVMDDDLLDRFENIAEANEDLGLEDPTNDRERDALAGPVIEGLVEQIRTLKNRVATMREARERETQDLENRCLGNPDCWPFLEEMEGNPMTFEELLEMVSSAGELRGFALLVEALFVAQGEGGTFRLTERGERALEMLREHWGRQ